MAISNAEFQTWLRKADAKRCVLLEAESWYRGASAMRYASDRGFTSGPTDTPQNTFYPPRIRSVPFFSITMGEQLTGRTTPASGQIVMDNTDGALDTMLLHAWDGRPFTLYIGDPTWARSDFRKMLSGVTEDISVPSRDRIALVIRDLRKTLDKPLTSTKIAAGPNIGKYYPVTFGQVYNVTPVLLDESTKQYAVHDGAIEDITDVREDGVTVTYTKDAATGTFTLASAATGTITCDVKGDKASSTYLNTTSDLIERIAKNRAGLVTADIHAASFAVLDGLQTGVVGLYAQDGSMSCLEALDALALGAGCWYGFDRSGLLRVGRVDEPAVPAANIGADDMYIGGFTLLRRMIPRATVRLGYKRRWTVQSTLDAAVTGDTRVMYSTPYDVKTATNAVPQHLLADAMDELGGTLFVDGTVTQTECTRRAALASKIRYLFSINVAIGGVNAQLGDTIRLTHPRYGFASGQNAVVAGIEEDPTSRRTRLTLWR